MIEKSSADGMDFSPLITVLEGDFNMEKASAVETDTLDDSTKQMSKGKPPRHISSMQHITSTTTSRLRVTYMTHKFWICIFFSLALWFK